MAGNAFILGTSTGVSIREVNFRFPQGLTDSKNKYAGTVSLDTNNYQSVMNSDILSVVNICNNQFQLESVEKPAVTCDASLGMLASLTL